MSTRFPIKLHKTLILSLFIFKSTSSWHKKNSFASSKVSEIFPYFKFIPNMFKFWLNFILKKRMMSYELDISRLIFRGAHLNCLSSRRTLKKYRVGVVDFAPVNRLPIITRGRAKRGAIWWNKQIKPGHCRNQAKSTHAPPGPSPRDTTPPLLAARQPMCSHARRSSLSSSST
jgi:hypothetical protein